MLLNCFAGVSKVFHGFVAIKQEYTFESVKKANGMWYYLSGSNHYKYTTFLCFSQRNQLKAMFGLGIQDEIQEVQKELQALGQNNVYELENTDVIIKVKQNQILMLSTAPNILDFDLMMAINKAFDLNLKEIEKKGEEIIASKSKAVQKVFAVLKSIYNEQ